MTVSINGTSGIVFNDASTQNTAATGFGFKNRIINGAMVIDQRNAGASVTPAISAYTVDRWQYQCSVASKMSIQQTPSATETGYATRVGAGFTNYLGFTTASAYTAASGELFEVAHKVEGFNFADFGWGTASATSVALSFWVRSSITGTHSGSFTNSAGNRSYPFTFTVSSSNTWEYKTIVVAGDTSGTWTGATNGVGVILYFDFGSGATFRGAAGAWASANYVGATGSVNVVGTNGATFYLTGVQLEKGSTATSFDYRPIGTELALCQRYYQKSFPQATAPADNQTGQPESGFFAYDTASGQSQFTQFIVTMRNSPAMTFYQANARGSTAGQWATYDGSSWTSLSTSAAAALTLSQNGFTFVGSRSGAFTGRSAYLVSGHYTASSEL